MRTANPVTVIGLDGPVATMLPGVEVTVYEVIGLPFDAGALKVTYICDVPAIAVTPVGVPGTPAGVTLLEAVDSAPEPTALVALTVKVYGMPLVKPPIVIGLEVLVAVVPPGVAVTLYEVIGLDKLCNGYTKLTVAEPLPAVAVTAPGAPGIEGAWNTTGLIISISS